MLNCGLLVGEGGGRVGESAEWVWQGASVASTMRGRGKGKYGRHQGHDRDWKFRTGGKLRARGT